MSTRDPSSLLVDPRIRRVVSLLEQHRLRAPECAKLLRFAKPPHPLRQPLELFGVSGLASLMTGFRWRSRRHCVEPRGCGTLLE
jgi:hypothetical protein